MKYEEAKLNNNEKFFKNRIQEHVNHIKFLCNDAGIPFFMIFATSQDEDTGKMNFTTEQILPEMLGLKPDEPTFTDMINVLNGFRTMPRASNEIVEMEVQEGEMDFPGFGNA